DRGEQVHTLEAAKALAERAQAVAAPLEEEDDLEDFGIAAEGEDADAEAGAPQEHTEGGSRRRRRRRRRGGRNGGEHAYGQSHEHIERVPITQSASDVGPQDHGASVDRSSGESAGESIAESASESLGEPRSEPAGDFAPEEQSEPSRQHRDERRRRRGRRGGRRNRQRGSDGYAGREPTVYPAEQDAAPTDQLAVPPVAEPELKDAVADLDAPPAPAIDRPTEPPAAEQQMRRRSTVRERAPISGSDEEAPERTEPQPGSLAPEPVVTETGSESEGERPRRSGWWSRRFAGG
ncbi:MAG TPA: hypothetical protein VEK31_09705, partial [Xanthobacteraceae bacterium]|nr:hypothetical protein [Xanthobacteraceae bacterium]